MANEKQSITNSHIESEKMAYLTALCDKVSLNVEDVISNGIDIADYQNSDDYNVYALIVNHLDALNTIRSQNT
jgi:hypothetical protein